MQTSLSSTRLYKALLEKDPSFEGIFVVGVRTTGIFCRPTCTARKPKRNNVEFFSTAQDALRFGYRPCKVCRPMSLAKDAPDWLKQLLKEVKIESGYRLSDRTIRDFGLDPNRVRRWFKIHHKMTFQSYLRSLRIGEAFGYLNKGGKVVDAAFDSGYESLSGFSSAFKKLTGKVPTKLVGNEIIKTYHLLTELGPMLAASVKAGICLLEFTDRRMLERELTDLQRKFKAPIITSESEHIRQLRKELEEYFSGSRKTFDIPICAPGSAFQEKVWKTLKQIPYGETRSYKEQAIALGSPRSIRAVARANGENKIAIVIPCHRVIGSNGALTGYGGGLERKKYLLELEQANKST